jgi:SRSO17 transposase
MQLPIISPAPIVTEHSEVFRHFFCDERQFRHFQNYLTGLIVLENKSLANISRCTLDSADKTNLSRFMSDAPWSQVEVNDARIEYMFCQTIGQRLPSSESFLIIDDTLCPHIGSMFEFVDRHYNHCNRTYPLAHNLVTSQYLSGPVRFPVNFEIYRRYEEFTHWESYVAKYFPEQELPKPGNARKQLHKRVEPTLLQDPDFFQLHQQFCSKIDIAMILVEAAIERGVPFSTLLIDSWYLSGDLAEHLKSKNKDWISLLKSNRNLEAYSIRLKDETGKRIKFDQPHIKVEALLPLIPKTAFRPVQAGKHTYWCFTLSVRIPKLGKVRIVISFETAELMGTYAVLITNRRDWSAKKILSKYLLRWPIETFYRDGKQHLGLDKYQMRTVEAIQSHWCFVFVAYSILHLACLPPPPKKGQRNRSAMPIKTIGQVCRQQGQEVVKKLILFAHKRLKDGNTAAEVFSQLFEKQNKEVLMA